ncbi:hypothetical protein RRG08_011468 [Elysia crispata]|uniref:Uncharacterized protein n=1 Tax=Elysia crispata TaxID=231223 RepID=A0AAE0ZPE9_9GAST|nr:hypothetical protein RRG08_011468 [Elysia crispata]
MKGPPEATINRRITVASTNINKILRHYRDKNITLINNNIYITLAITKISINLAIRNSNTTLATIQSNNTLAIIDSKITLVTRITSPQHSQQQYHARHHQEQHNTLAI